MGRLLTGGTSSSSSGSGSTSVLNTTLVTGEAVTANSLAVVAGDNKAYMAMEAGLPGSTLRPIFQAADMTNGLQSPATLFATGIQGRVVGAGLATGNFVVAWVAAASPYNLSFAIYSPQGVPVTAPTVVGPTIAAGGGGSPLPCLAALAGGGFVVAYNNAGTPRFAIYSNIGALVNGPVGIDAAATIGAMSVAALTGGGFAVCYTLLITADTATYAVYTATGTIVQSATLLRQGVGNNPITTTSKVVALAGGGFVCAYALNSSGSSVVVNTYFKIFTAAGALVGSEVALRSGLVQSGITAAGIVGGGFAIVESADVRLSVYSATGVLQGAASAKDAGVGQKSVAITSLASGGGLFSWLSSPAGTIKVAQFDSSGGSSVVNIATTSSVIEQLTVFDNGAAGSVVGFSDVTANKLSVTTLSPSLTTISTNVYSSVPCDFSVNYLAGFGFALASTVKSGAVTFLLATASASAVGSFCIVNAFVPRCVPIGMFTASAAAGAGAPVQITGTATLATSFSQQIAVDYRANTPPGQRLSIVGNSLNLQGIQ